MTPHLPSPPQPPVTNRAPAVPRHAAVDRSFVDQPAEAGPSTGAPIRPTNVRLGISAATTAALDQSEDYMDLLQDMELEFQAESPPSPTQGRVLRSQAAEPVTPTRQSARQTARRRGGGGLSASPTKTRGSRKRLGDGDGETGREEQVGDSGSKRRRTSGKKGEETGSVAVPRTPKKGTGDAPLTAAGVSHFTSDKSRILS